MPLAGFARIDAVFMDGDATDARLQQICHNLFHADLTKLQRAEHVAEWVRLTDEKFKALQVPTPVGGQQPAEIGVRKAARELNLDAGTVSRAAKIDGISLEAKAAAQAAGLDDNQSALFAIANEMKPEAQLQKVRELTERKRGPRRKRTTGSGGGPNGEIGILEDTELSETIDTALVPPDPNCLSKVAAIELAGKSQLLRSTGLEMPAHDGASEAVISCPPEHELERTTAREALRAVSREPATDSSAQMSDIPMFLERLDPANEAVLSDLMGTFHRDVMPKLISAPSVVRQTFLDEIERLVRAM
jgi:hypothetical protein